MYIYSVNNEYRRQYIITITIERLHMVTCLHSLSIQTQFP